MPELLPVVTDPGYPDVHGISVTDPCTGGPGGTLNMGVEAVAERTDHLKARAVALETARADHETRLATVETSGAVSANRVTELMASEVMAIEAFAGPPYIWREIDPRAIVQTVAGDESVDVDSTAGLTQGDAYVIRDADGTTEVVTVQTILTEQRFRATATLSKSREATGTLSRTSWDVQAGYALAGDGGVLISRSLRVLRYDGSGRVMLRRDDGDGAIALDVRAAGSGAAWTACPLVSSTAVADEQNRVDLEYTVPLGGVVQLRLTATVGESKKPIRVDHIRALPPIDAVRDLVRRPLAVSPPDGAVDVSETPVLTSTPFYSLYGVDQADAEIRIATDPLMTTVIHTGTLGAAGVEYAVPADVLTTQGRFWWDMRHQDAEGQWSLRGEPAGFSCASVFSYVVAPTIVTPAEGATSVGLTPTITLSAFRAVGAEDTHAATRIQVATLKADGSPDWEAGLLVDLTLGAVTATTLDTAEALPRNTTLALRAAFDGATLGAGGWSTTRTITTANSGDAPTVTSPVAEATIGTMPTITLSSFSFPGTGEAHVASQYRVTGSDGNTVLYDSGETTDLTSHTVASALPNLTDVLITARQKGGTTGWTPWSEAVACTTEMPSGEATYATAGTSTFTVPENVSRIRVRVIGAGGASAVSAFPVGAGGGGGGGGCQSEYDVTPGDEYEVVVGTGGVRGTSPTNGGSSSFSTLMTATGGCAGGTTGGAAARYLGGAGGQGYGGNLLNGTGGQGGQGDKSNQNGNRTNGGDAVDIGAGGGPGEAMSGWGTGILNEGMGKGGQGGSITSAPDGLDGLVLIEWGPEITA